MLPTLTYFENSLPEKYFNIFAIECTFFFALTGAYDAEW